MAAMGPFVRDAEVVRLGIEIHELIGVELPANRWQDVARQCRDMKPEEALKAAADKEARKVWEERAKERDVRAQREQRRASGEISALPVRVPIPPAWLALDSDQGEIALQRPHVAQGPTGIIPFFEALHFSRWPSPFPPMCLSLLGSWCPSQPEVMQWTCGLFMCPITVGSTGQESFQILVGGQRDHVIYPSIANANHLDQCDICGPDRQSEGRAWCIGKGRPAEDNARPGSRFAIVAAIDASARVQLVGWQSF